MWALVKAATVTHDKDANAASSGTGVSPESDRTQVTRANLN